VLIGHKTIARKCTWQIEWKDQCVSRLRDRDRRKGGKSATETCEPIVPKRGIRINCYSRKEQGDIKVKNRSILGNELGIYLITKKPQARPTFQQLSGDEKGRDITGGRGGWERWGRKHHQLRLKAW